MKKIAVVHGEWSSDVMRRAFALLSEFILDYTFEYPVGFDCDKAENLDVLLENYHPIYIGTKQNNSYIRNNSDFCLQHPEEYGINVSNGKIIVEGFDDRGVLYGCIDLYNKYFITQEYPHNGEYVLPIEKWRFADYRYSSYPSVKERGIWTWGHVIYDWRGFIDNMVKLKMNTLTVWNDYPPVNAREMVDYAHSCGIKVIWGFPWLWDTDCKKIPFDRLCEYSEGIFRGYDEEYRDLPIDGIYFQTVTEFGEETVGGITVAEAVTAFVNHTAAYFYEKYPNLEIQFGLHAECVKNKLEYIEKVDKRIKIVWENCGAFPFAYMPNKLDNFTETVDFVKRITTLRGENERFGAVTKGLTKLDWSAFEHLGGPIWTGVSSKWMKENRIIRKRKIWRYLQAYWLTNSDKALEMVRIMANHTRGNTTITALVEDGMFEENIYFPVALFSEMLWNADGDIKSIINEVALRSYVEFA